MKKNTQIISWPKKGLELSVMKYNYNTIQTEPKNVINFHFLNDANNNNNK